MTRPSGGRIPRERPEGSGGRGGATLVALCIGLAVAAILVASAAVLYTGALRKARMAQARKGLVRLQRTEALHLAEWNRFTDDLGAIDLDPDRYDHYSFSVGLDDGGRSYTGYAHGLGPMEGDLWTVGPRGEPTQDPAARRRFE